MPDVTRIIEQKATESIYNDDWALIDRPTEGEDGGTRKILVSRLKELLCGDYIADEWVAGETYTNGAIVSHEGKLYYNNSGGALVQTTFNPNAWLEVKIDELLEKVISSVGQKWRLVDTYHYDDLVVYGGRLYRCIKNASTQGTWVSNEWIEANAEYYFKKVREYIARYGFIPSREAVSSPYNKGDLILYRAPGDTTNSLYMRLNDTENGDPTWIPENWLKVENIGGALSKIYDDMEESSCDVQIKEQSIIDENKVADLTSLAMVGSASGAIASFDDGSDLPMPKLEVAIEPQQEGSGEPSPTNVRPISGHTEANVGVSGINVWDEEWEVGGLNPLNGDATSENDRIRSKNFRPCKPNMTMFYYIPSGKGNLQIVFYDINKNYLGYYNFTTEHTFTTPNGCYFFKFNTGGSYGTTYNNDISINYPSTDTSYHAYNGQTYTIQFKDGDNPLTVYGGSLDVVSGVLTVDRAIKLVSECTWYGSNEVFYTDKAVSTIKKGDGRYDHCISDAYKTVNKATSGQLSDGEMSVDASGYIQLKDLRYSSSSDFKTAMGSVQLVYELANPITYQLTPTQVKSLLGVNNIWADTGDILDGEYIRDATTIINSLIARIEVLENS